MLPAAGAFICGFTALSMAHRAASSNDPVAAQVRDAVGAFAQGAVLVTGTVVLAECGTPGLAWLLAAPCVVMLVVSFYFSFIMWLKQRRSLARLRRTTESFDDTR